MSSLSSDGTLKERIGEALEQNARRAPSMRVSATSIAQQIDADPERVAPLLVEFARDHLLRPILIERCDEGHIASGVLGNGGERAEAYCRVCEARVPIRHYVVYQFAEQLIAEAKDGRPKAQRRRAPLLQALALAVLKILHFPGRMQQPRRY
jgi:hypothetical protein